MDRSAGRMFAHAASFSLTSRLASSAAASELGSVVMTSTASVIRGSALPEAAQGAGDCGRTLQPLGGHPADDPRPARGHHAEPAAHGELQQAAVQLHPDLALWVAGHDVLEEKDSQVADFSVGLGG